jgi:hypothetical protein
LWLGFGFHTVVVDGVVDFVVVVVVDIVVVDIAVVGFRLNRNGCRRIGCSGIDGWQKSIQSCRR